MPARENGFDEQGAAPISAALSLPLQPRSNIMNNRRRRIYEGKAKVLYEGPEPGTLIQHFKDDATAFNAKKHEVIDGKGVLNNRISEYVFTQLNAIGVPTHFIKRLNMREQLIPRGRDHPARGGGAQCRSRQPRDPARNRGRHAAAPLDHRILLQEGRTQRPDGVREHITAFGWANPQELDDIMALAIRINDFLTGLFLGVGIRLVDFKIETGRLLRGRHDAHRARRRDQPDSCRLWDIKSNDKMDKDRFRRDMGGLIEAYSEVARRLGIISEGERPVQGGPRLVK